MTREVDLVSYLPPFMKSYKEVTGALKAKNPEFALVWESANRILYNHFITTADEYGISRYERILGITPYAGDTLEMRRTRVQSRWINSAPHTIRILAFKLQQLLGEDNFSLYSDFEDGYSLLLVVYSTDDRQVEELRYLLETIVPMDVVVDIVYETATSGVVIYSGVLMEQADILEIKQR